MDSYSLKFFNHALSDSGSHCSEQERCRHSSNKSSDFSVLSCEFFGSEGTHSSDSSSSFSPTQCPWDNALHSGIFSPQARPTLRNSSVTSPTSQEVAWKLSPLEGHVGSSTITMQLAGNRDKFSEVQIRRGTEVSHRTSSIPAARLSTCDDPYTGYSDLLKNGRDVPMDAVDILQIRLREIGPFMATAPEISEATQTLKRRLEQVRAKIRKELASLTAQNAGSPGFRGTGRRGKKCKFCLSKKEESVIVEHHNLFDASGLVSCPILQQYECELCHATGRYAHTIKYCPSNNPSTPHHIVLQARLRVMLRNRHMVRLC